MRKRNLVLLSVLLCGLLVCGIGTGVMIGEFSALNYGGEYLCEPVDPKTEVFSVSLDEVPEGMILISGYAADPFFSQEQTVRTDDTLQEGTVQIKVSYDAGFCSPFFFLEPADPESGFDYAGMLEMGFYSLQDDFYTLMQLKDVVLQDLKSNTIRTYRSEPVLSTEFFAAPETAARLSF